MREIARKHIFQSLFPSSCDATRLLFNSKEAKSEALLYLIGHLCFYRSISKWLLCSFQAPLLLVSTIDVQMNR